MKHLKIAYDPEAERYFSTTREKVRIEDTDFTDVAGVVLTDGRAAFVDKVSETQFGIPIFMIVKNNYTSLDKATLEKIFHLMDCNHYDEKLYSRQIEAAAEEYEENVLPPFFKNLSKYFDQGNLQFDTPGHHGGQFFRKHPAGRYFYDFYGENVFRSDISSSDVKLGDLLIHEGPAYQAERHAAKVYNADKTYFVMNGTSTSNA
ncbi:Orn/Lys/Arg decarboxylase N-terminal domain-containing protein, partial [Sporolactobacillus sp. CQH2019]|uniref:Orn/Lys/Arg decarboxylase N-terminal domain-containing protein n=2 Tax=unclassified Sporolactobacillus TaxID=2628533 RepID=UPI0023684AC3